MEEILEEIRILKERVSILESNKPSEVCYEKRLGEISIVSILKCKDDLYIQMCNYILKYNIIQIIDDKLYICHKGSWIKGNDALNTLFSFIEQRWILLYLDFISKEDHLTGQQFETFNEVIYNLNFKKNLGKIKQYIIDKIKDNI
jgi:hypothetical protein